MNRYFRFSIIGALVSCSALAAVPETPSDLSVAPAGLRALALRWSDRSDNETGFVVERLGAAWETVATVPANQAWYVAKGLAPAAAGTYRVRAANADGLSAPSSQASGVTLPDRRLNVVMIIADDLGVFDLAALHDPLASGPTIYETPATDQLVRESTVFANAYCSGPKCVVARRAIQMGRYDFRADALPASGGEGLDASEKTIGEAFKEVGYRTAYIGKWHLGGLPIYPERLPENQGYDVSIAAGEFGAPNPSYFSPYNLPNLIDGPPGEYLTRRLTFEARAFIDDHVANHPTQPFFLTLAHYAVHTPLEAPADQVAHFDAVKAATDFSTHPAYGQPVKIDLTSRVRQLQDQTTYAAMLRVFDDSVAGLRAKLAARGLADNTIVVLTSDHGGKSSHAVNDLDDPGIPTSNFPLRQGKTWCYEGGLRIPLIVYFPGVTRGLRISDALVNGCDIYSTLLEMTGSPAQPAQARDSVSFADTVAVPEYSPRTVNYHWFTNADSGTGNLGLGVFRQGSLKLVHFIFGRYSELYDLSTDPIESVNLASIRPDVVREMEAELFAKRLEVDASTPAHRTANQADIKLGPGQTGWEEEIRNLKRVATLPSRPDVPPGGLVATALGSSAVRLGWTDNATNEHGYVILCSTPEMRAAGVTSLKEIAYVPASAAQVAGTGAREFIHTGLGASGIYRYRVQASNISGWATAAAPTTLYVSVTTSALSNPVPLTPTADSATVLPGETRRIAVLLNDMGEGLTITAVSAPTLGTAMIDGGRVVYTCHVGAAGSDSFTYTVRDRTGATATVPVNVSILLPAPVSVDVKEDTYVRKDGLNAGTNFGTTSNLELRTDADGFTRRAYLRFDTSAVVGKFSSVKLQITSVDHVGDMQVYGLSDSGWTETGLTWSNQPTAPPLLLGSVTAPAAGATVELDVSSYLKSPGLHGFVIKSLLGVRTRIGSREGGAPARLIIQRAADRAPSVSPLVGMVVDFGETAAEERFEIADTETPASALSVSVTSTNAALLPASGLVLSGSGRERRIAITPATGQVGTVTVLVNVGDGLNFTRRSFTVTVLGATDTWRRRCFATTLSDGEASDTADPNRDGMPNLLEFFLGRNPVGPNDPTTLPSVGLEAGQLTLTYQRSKAALFDVTGHVLTTTDLIAGGWSATGVSETVTSENAEAQVVKARVPLDAPKRFLRLDVDRD